MNDYKRETPIMNALPVNLITTNSAQTPTEFFMTDEEIMAGIFWTKSQLMKSILDQQDKIQELEAFKKEALEVISFYGSDDNWVEPWAEPTDVVDRDNLEGGKRAREFLKKHEVRAQ